jgi:hypothetical protein
LSPSREWIDQESHDNASFTPYRACANCLMSEDYDIASDSFNPPWRAQEIWKPGFFYGYSLLSCLSGHHS